MAMLSFSSINETAGEDFGNCPLGSTEIVASCTSGCYSVVIFGQSYALNEAETEIAENRLQNYCNNRPIVSIATAPPVL
ncbi:hypothetical protein [Nonlabens sp. Asnod3-A02]|uniref:hypothetical protein n=1 Tax=Nonlabens sp. Asnod3-A02 TaxID=3160579 RepID=UPI00386538EA